MWVGGFRFDDFELICRGQAMLSSSLRGSVAIQYIEDEGAEIFKRQ